MRPLSAILILLAGPVISSPLPGVEAAQGGGCAGFEACFVASGAGPGAIFFNNCTPNEGGTQFMWDFGDGTTGTAVAPTHTYTVPGLYEVCLTAYWQNCVDSTCTTVLVQGGDPCLGLQVAFTHTTTPNGTLFSNGSTGTGFQTTFLWTFGDGSSSTDAQPFHAYTTAGIYQVCLKVISIYEQPNGPPITCEEVTCAMITVGGGDPCAGFEACFVPSGAGPGAIFFNNCTSNQAGTQFVWDFGDGNDGTAVAPTHTYAAPGLYQVCLTAYWQNCVDSTCTPVVVQGTDPCQGLQAGFTSSTTPNGTQFSNGTMGTGFQTTFSWTFGDGSSSSDPQPFHTYTAPGNYEVCLLVLSIYTQPNGQVITCQDSHCAVVPIGGGNPCDGLNAGFIGEGGISGVNFANAVIDLSWTYLWNFGDGTEAYGPNPFHVYPGPGTYHTCLVVYTWDPIAQDTCFADHCEWITVGGDPCDQLEACILVNTLGGGSFLFENCSSIIQNAQFMWDFGDGTTSSDVIADHTYSQPGTYTVCLTAYWQNCVDSTCTTVTVAGGGPCAGLDAGFAFNTTPNGTQFTNSTTGTGFQTIFTWNFGDGNSSNMPQPFHTYAAPGSYEVCLEVLSIFQGPNGQLITCLDSSCELVVIGGGPCANYLACFDALPFENGVFYFQNCSSQPAQAEFLWLFGDGSTSTSVSPDHAFPAGVYQVCLIADWGDCQDSTCVTITVGEGLGCDPNFACDFTWTAQGIAVVFVGTTNRQTDGFVWEFGDGTEGYGEIITHLYEPPGPFEVCLNAWSWNEQEQDTCWTRTCHLVDPFNIVTAIGELGDDAVSIYPVPASDVITLSGLPASGALRLFAPDGRLLLSERITGTTHQVQVSDLASGTYVMRLDLDGRTIHRKVMVE